MDAMTVKATNFILSMLAHLPFLEGSPVAVPAHLRCYGKGHFSTLLGVTLAHDAMA